MLHSVAQAFFDQTGLSWQELEAHYRRESLGQVRGHLGQQFESAYAECMKLTPTRLSGLVSGKAFPTLTFSSDISADYAYL